MQPSAAADVLPRAGPSASANTVPSQSWVPSLIQQCAPAVLGGLSDAVNTTDRAFDAALQYVRGGEEGVAEPSTSPRTSEQGEAQPWYGDTESEDTPLVGSQAQGSGPGEV